MAKVAVFAVCIASLLAVALSTSVSVASVDVRDNSCPSYVQLLPSLANYFNGLATTDDIAALVTVCENNCLVELEADIKGYLSPDDEVVCGLDGATLSSLVDVLAEFICLRETEEEDSAYCVQSIQTSMSDAGIDLQNLDPEAISIDAVCAAAAGAGCCTATYFAVLQGALNMACASTLSSYLGLIVSFCPLLTPSTVPDACEHFTVPTFDVPNPCPVKETNCTEIAEGCEESICQMLDCVPDISGVTVSAGGIEGIEILVDAVLSSLTGAADVSGVCLAEAYDSVYTYQTGGSTGDDDIGGNNDANGAAVARGSLVAAAATILVSYFVM